jgi:hypothetical protein
MSEKEELIRADYENLAIFEFGRFIEGLMRENKEFEGGEIRVDFKRGYPDAVLHMKLKSQDDETKVRIEFEGESRNFRKHLKDDPNSERCDLIVCTQHNWGKESPLPVWEVLWGGNINTFEAHQDAKGSFYEQLKKLRRNNRVH